MRFSRSIILALVLSLASLLLVTPAFLFGSRYSTWSHRLPTLHDLSRWGRAHPSPYGGLGPMIGYLDPVLAFHYLGATPWYLSRDLGFPEPLQDYQIAIPATSALSWGLLGVLLGGALDWRYSRRLVRRAGQSGSPVEAVLAEDLPRLALRAAAWSGGIFIALGILVLCILPPLITLYRISSLQSPDPAVRRRTMAGFFPEVQVGVRFRTSPRPKVVPRTSGDWEARIDCILVGDLRRVGERFDLAWPMLVTMVNDPDPDVQRAVIRTLGDAGLHPSATAQALLPLLNHPSANVRYEAVGALARLGYFSDEVFAAIARATDDPITYVRCEAVQALATLGTDDRRTLDLLIDLLRHGKPDLRESAARVLCRLGPAAEPAVPFLVAAIADHDAQLTACARYALCAIARNPRESVPALIEALKDPGDRELRFLAARTLGSFGPDAKDALPALRQLLRDSDPHSSQAIAATQAITNIDR